MTPKILPALVFFTSCVTAQQPTPTDRSCPGTEMPAPNKGVEGNDFIEVNGRPVMAPVPYTQFACTGDGRLAGKARSM